MIRFLKDRKIELKEKAVIRFGRVAFRIKEMILNTDRKQTANELMVEVGKDLFTHVNQVKLHSYNSQGTVGGGPDESANPL